MLMERAQRLDDITRTIGIIIDMKLTNAKHKMEIVSRMPDILNNKMLNLRHGLEHSNQMLSSLGYKKVLARGYAIVRDSAGKIISHSENAPQPATIEFSDGFFRL